MITGASSGNGRAIALAFARAGARLVLAARAPGPLEQAAADCQALGAEALACPADVGDARAVTALSELAIARYGHIDIWINDAGVLQYGRFEETPAEAVEQLVRTNLIGCMNGCRVALQHFRGRGRGMLINVGSILGLFGHPYTAAYVASKAAIAGLTESLRAETADAPQIHVCLVLPAAIDTPIYSRAANYAGRAVRPIWALYPPEVVARATLSLARRPRPHAYAGSFGPLAVWGRRLAPGLQQRLVRAGAEIMELSGPPQAAFAGNLAEPRHDDGRSLRGGWRLRYAARAAGVAALTVGGLLALARLRRTSSVRR